MYGYVQVYRPDLRFREYEVYRSHYCGLCHALQQRCNAISRPMTLHFYRCCWMPSMSQKPIRTSNAAFVALERMQRSITVQFWTM